MSMFALVWDSKEHHTLVCTRGLQLGYYLDIIVKNNCEVNERGTHALFFIGFWMFLMGEMPTALVV